MVAITLHATTASLPFEPTFGRRGGEEDPVLSRVGEKRRIDGRRSSL
jgi:hypothetical protein